MKPLYIINFKAYKETTGDKGLKVAKSLDKFAKKSKEKIILAVAPTDIRMISRAVKIPVYAQHIDPVSPGAKTGHVTLEAVLAAGAKGVIINHSENRRDTKFIGEAVKLIKAKRKKVIVCAKDPTEGAKLARFKPDFIAVEPPELIGGDVSVSKAKPQIIEKSVKKISVPVLVGAGVKDFSDVKVAMKLGAKGVLVASGIVKKKNIEEAIKGLTS
ncbi:MAG: triose-phosphate isomerase [Candidatus Altiarchaeota archaeon]|nr:triose-phosphate isomerase [Candidatus Altiarchaeota archaeon]